MKLPDIVVELLEKVTPEEKLETIKRKLPKGVNVEVHNESRFGISIDDWKGTCSYLATIANIPKFIDWVKGKKKQIEEEQIMNMSSIRANIINDNNLTEEKLSKMFKGKHKVLKKYVDENKDILEKYKDKMSIITKAVEKPNIRLWDTGLKLNKVGVVKI